MIEIGDLKTENPTIHSFFRVNGDELFDYLYTINMKFSSEGQLDHFFKNYFILKIKSFEEGAENYDINGYNEVTSFSNSQMDSVKNFLLKHSP